MFLSKEASLRSLLPKAVQATKGPEAPKGSEPVKAPSSAGISKEAGFTFQPPELKPHNTYMMDDEQHRMFAVYKFGGNWDLGDGEKYYPAKDPRIKGALAATFNAAMHEATNIAIGNLPASPGEVMKRNRELVMKGIDSYDPLAVTKSIGKDKFKPSAKLQTWVIGYMRPEAMGGGAAAQTEAQRIGQNKAVGTEYIPYLGPARREMDEFQKMMGRPISAEELSKKLGKDLIWTQRLMRMMADEHDPDFSLDAEATAPEQSLAQKGAIKTAYSDFRRQNNIKAMRIMEWMFPDFLPPLIVPPPSAKTSTGKVYSKWMAQQLGIDSARVSDLRNKVVVPAINEQIGYNI
jgi:hypothetical protein